MIDSSKVDALLDELLMIEAAYLGANSAERTAKRNAVRRWAQGLPQPPTASHPWSSQNGASFWMSDPEQQRIWLSFESRVDFDAMIGILESDRLSVTKAEPPTAYLDATGESCPSHPYTPHVLPGAPKDRCHECGMFPEHPIHAVTKETPRCICDFDTGHGGSPRCPVHDAVEKPELPPQRSMTTEESASYRRFIDKHFDGASPETDAGLFYILSIKHSLNTDEYMTLWRPNDCGYTLYLPAAGKYTRAAVCAHPDYYNNGKTTAAVPCHAVDRRGVAASEGYDCAGPVVPNDGATWTELLSHRLSESEEGSRP